MAHDKCNYFSFWATCCPSHPQQLKKSKNFKKMKKTEIWCATDRQTDGQKKDILASPKNGKKRTGKSKLF